MCRLFPVHFVSSVAPPGGIPIVNSGYFIVIGGNIVGERENGSIVVWRGKHEMR